jgi:hypothetical protein
VPGRPPTPVGVFEERPPPELVYMKSVSLEGVPGARIAFEVEHGFARMYHWLEEHAFSLP